MRWGVEVLIISSLMTATTPRSLGAKHTNTHSSLYTTRHHTTPTPLDRRRQSKGPSTFLRRWLPPCARPPPARRGPWGAGQQRRPSSRGRSPWRSAACRGSTTPSRTPSTASTPRRYVRACVEKAGPGGLCLGSNRSIDRSIIKSAGHHDHDLIAAAEPAAAHVNTDGASI
jgi:hypothetical protein